MSDTSISEEFVMSSCILEFSFASGILDPRKSSSEPDKGLDDVVVALGLNKVVKTFLLVSVVVSFTVVLDEIFLGVVFSSGVLFGATYSTVA